MRELRRGRKKVKSFSLDGTEVLKNKGIDNVKQIYIIMV
jgi:hypothetical protein